MISDWIPGVLSRAQVQQLSDEGHILDIVSDAIDESAVDLHLTESGYHLPNGSVKPVRIVRVSSDDVTRRSDAYLAFRETVIENERSYPNIKKWLDGKVASGLRSKARVAYLGLLDEVPVATAVVKKDADSKFCHLRLAEGLRDQNVGELFFALMALEVRSYARDVHFTLPESLWAEKAEFFRTFGFEQVAVASRQYRLFDSELRTRTSFAAIWQSVIGKLPKLANRLTVSGHSLAPGVLLSIAPRFATRIMTGAKAVEIRRKFSTKWIGSRVVIYATAPSRMLAGEGKIRDVITDHPEVVWDLFKTTMGCTLAEYRSYVRGCERVYALMLDDITPYREPIPISQLEHLIHAPLRAPQSYCRTNDNDWSAATAIAALLHGAVRATLARSVPRSLPRSSEARQDVLFA